MKRRSLFGCSLLFLVLTCLPAVLAAQGTPADYERANALRAKFQGLAANIPERPNWIEKTPRFWYRKSVKGGNEFVLVDAEKKAKSPAFDHVKLAAALSAAAKEKYTAVTLPFSTFTYVDNEKSIEFNIGESKWKCELLKYVCVKVGYSYRTSIMSGVSRLSFIWYLPPAAVTAFGMTSPKAI